MAVSVPCRSSASLCSRQMNECESIVKLRADRKQILRMIWPRLYGKIWPRTATRSGRDSGPNVVVDSGRSRAENDDQIYALHMTTIGTTVGPPAIPRSMLDLCSAPCKALRFAPTAFSRGLRALTVPAPRSPSWQLRDGRECDDTLGRIFIVDAESERR